MKDGAAQFFCYTPDRNRREDKMTRYLASVLCGTLLLAGCDDSPAPNSAAPSDDIVLENIEWQLVAIGQTLMMGYDGDRGASLILDPQGHKIAGSTGCNRYFGTYSLQNEQLSFSAAAMTRMACSEPLMAQEQQFIEALGEVTGYRMDGRALELLSGTEAVARFEPRAKS